MFIEAWVQASSGNLDQTLNQIDKEIRIALQADLTQGYSAVLDTQNGDIAEPEFDDSGKRTGRMTMEYLVRYRRARTDPST